MEDKKTKFIIVLGATALILIFPIEWYWFYKRSGWVMACMITLGSIVALWAVQLIYEFLNDKFNRTVMPYIDRWLNRR